MQHYMLVLWDYGMVPEILGPYDKESRDKRAKDFLKEDKRCKITYIDIVEGEYPRFMKVYCDKGKSLTFASPS